MRTILALAAVALCLGACSESPQTGTYQSDADATPTDQRTTAMTDEPTDTETADAPAAAPVLEGITVNRIDGTAESLAETWAGKTLLIVNTASLCGMTPQYEGLEAMYRAHKDKGLVVLGFPANDFMGQEPGTNKEIAAFCETEYAISFPMYEKITVKGDNAHELFQRLAQATEAPSWNFTKYLVTPDGTITRFGPRTEPIDAELVEAVEAALTQG